jgi:predicted DNA-binding transcriptional regulator AlpA
VRKEQLCEAFRGMPILVRPKHIKQALEPFLGPLTRSQLDSVIKGARLPRPLRLTSKCVLFDREKTIEALAARLCETEGGVA